MKQISEEDIEKKQVKLYKKTLRKSFLTWLFFNGSSQSGERMQGVAFAHAVSPIIDQLYHTKEARAEAYERHLMLFNVEPQVGSVIVGATAAMEEEKANGSDIEDDTISTIKVALMGPLSGIGDSVVIGTFMPILLAIAIGITNAAGIIGPISYLIAYPLITVLYSWYLYKFGYNVGINGIQNVMSSGKIDSLTNALNVLGLLVMGALSASYIEVETPLTYQSGEMELSLQDILDQIFPELLPLIVIGIVYYLLSNRKKSAIWVMGFLFIFALIGTAIKLF